MTWYYDLSPFSLACSCMVEWSLGLMCRNGTSRFPSPRPRPRAWGRPGQAGCPPLSHPRALLSPPSPRPVPVPAGAGAGALAWLGGAEGPACGALCMPGQRWGPGTGVSPRPCHPLRTVTVINMASTCDPHGAGGAASPEPGSWPSPRLARGVTLVPCPWRLSRRSLCRCSGRQTANSAPWKAVPSPFIW